MIAFQTYGLVVAGPMINYAKQQFKGGDLKVIHDFLLEIGKKIDIVSTKY